MIAWTHIKFKGKIKIKNNYLLQKSLTDLASLIIRFQIEMRQCNSLIWKDVP